MVFFMGYAFGVLRPIRLPTAHDLWEWAAPDRSFSDIREITKENGVFHEITPMACCAHGDDDSIWAQKKVTSWPPFYYAFGSNFSIP